VEPKNQPQRPLEWWRRGGLWLMFLGSVAGVVLNIYVAAYADVSIFGILASYTLFVFTGALVYIGLFPKKFVEKFQDVSFGISNFAPVAFAAAVLVLGLTIWWDVAIA